MRYFTGYHEYEWIAQNIVEHFTVCTSLAIIVRLLQGKIQGLTRGVVGI